MKRNFICFRADSYEDHSQTIDFPNLPNFAQNVRLRNIRPAIGAPNSNILRNQRDLAYWESQDSLFSYRRGETIFQQRPFIDPPRYHTNSTIGSSRRFDEYSRNSFVEHPSHRENSIVGSNRTFDRSSQNSFFDHSRYTANSTVGSSRMFDLSSQNSFFDHPSDRANSTYSSDRTIYQHNSSSITDSLRYRENSTNSLKYERSDPPPYEEGDFWEGHQRTISSIYRYSHFKFDCNFSTN